MYTMFTKYHPLYATTDIWRYTMQDFQKTQQLRFYVPPDTK